MGDKLKQAEVKNNVQNALLATYQNRNEALTHKNVVLTNKLVKSQQYARKIDEKISKELFPVTSKFEQLSKENETLRKMVKIQEEVKDFEQKERDLRVKEKSSNNSLHALKPIDMPGEIYDSPNPFNKSPRKKKKPLGKLKINMGSDDVLKTILNKKSQTCRRERSGSFYFGSQTNDKSQESGFDNFDFSMNESSKTPMVPKNNESNVFSFPSPPKTKARRKRHLEES